jgi:hypothetical protein
MKTMLTSVLLLGLLAGCGDSADLSGSYTVSVTNRENGCELDNWTEGNQASNIAVVITQEGDEAQADVEGVTGGVLDLWLGSSVFAGTVDGEDFVLTIFGQNSFTEGNCSFTFNAELDGSIDGDFISGDIRYIAKTNNNPDCTALEGCVTRQSFNGSRPPQ